MERPRYNASSVDHVALTGRLLLPGLWQVIVRLASCCRNIEFAFMALAADGPVSADPVSVFEDADLRPEVLARTEGRLILHMRMRLRATCTM